MNKDFEVIFYMTNGDIYKFQYKDESLEDIRNYLDEGIIKPYLGDGEGIHFISTKNITAFEIKEKEEVTA